MPQLQELVERIQTDHHRRMIEDAAHLVFQELLHPLAFTDWQGNQCRGEAEAVRAWYLTGLHIGNARNPAGPEAAWDASQGHTINYLLTPRSTNTGEPGNSSLFVRVGDDLLEHVYRPGDQWYTTAQFTVSGDLLHQVLYGSRTGLAVSNLIANSQLASPQDRQALGVYGPGAARQANESPYPFFAPPIRIFTLGSVESEIIPRSRRPLGSDLEIPRYLSHRAIAQHMGLDAEAINELLGELPGAAVDVALAAALRQTLVPEISASSTGNPCREEGCEVEEEAPKKRPRRAQGLDLSRIYPDEDDT